MVLLAVLVWQKHSWFQCVDRGLGPTVGVAHFFSFVAPAFRETPRCSALSFSEHEVYLTDYCCMLGRQEPAHGPFGLVTRQPVLYPAEKRIVCYGRLRLFDVNLGPNS